MESMNMETEMMMMDKWQEQELYTLACKILEENLIRYRNIPTQDQKDALGEIISYYVRLCSGRISGRFAFALPTGLGKTQSIVAFITALTQLGLDDIGVTVCTNKVEALCDLKRDLEEKHHVPSEKIGLLHSLKGKASMPSCKEEDIGNYQILLLTHQRVKTRMDKCNLYRGIPRQLSIWDESLIKSNTFIFNDERLSGAIAELREYQRETPPGRLEAVFYLETCKEIYTKELRRQKEDGASPQSIKFPVLEGHIEEYKAAVQLSADNSNSKLLSDFLDVCQENFRILTNVVQGGGLLAFQVVVPQGLENIVILDASYNIRELARMDKTVTEVSLNRDLVSYTDLTVYQLESPSGRSSMDKEFSRKKKSERVITKEVAEVIKAIPPNEGIILFSFKEHSLNYFNILLKDLEHYGIDVAGQIDTPDGEKPRIVLLTWGCETSLSEYSYCTNVILVGVLHRSYLDIASAICGQTDNLLYPATNRNIKRVLESEVVHCVYQAISRGSIRVIRGCQAKAMKAWIIHPDAKELYRAISEVMPGVQWKKWETKYFKSKAEIGTKGAVVVKKIQTYLRQKQQEGIQVISTCQINKDLGLTRVHRNTISSALTKAIEGTTWVRMGKSIEQLFPDLTPECTEELRVA